MPEIKESAEKKPKKAQKESSVPLQSPKPEKKDGPKGKVKKEKQPKEQDKDNQQEDIEVTVDEQHKAQSEESKEEESEDSVKNSEVYKALNEKYLRLYAEFDNFRKRSAKESLELVQTANSELITQLIPTLENFEIAFAPEKRAGKLEDFEAGIKMIYNSFKEILEEEGLEEINPVGEEFDPVYHEAMLEQYHDTVEEGHVIQVYQKGYKLKSKILKHAKVIISKGEEPK
jgi:molecular chaperone GrpE